MFLRRILLDGQGRKIASGNASKNCAKGLCVATKVQIFEIIL
jgi:hypothetical protein